MKSLLFRASLHFKYKHSDGTGPELIDIQLKHVIRNNALPEITHDYKWSLIKAADVFPIYILPAYNFLLTVYRIACIV